MPASTSVLFSSRGFLQLSVERPRTRTESAIVALIGGSLSHPRFSPALRGARSEELSRLDESSKARGRRRGHGFPELPLFSAVFP
jgi:hypothetical protein